MSDVGVPWPGRSAVPAPKTAVPAPPRTLLSRQRLLDLLAPDAHGDTPVTLVCGPAGSGKTTLLADWVLRRPGIRDAAVAWVSLGPEDNEAFVLWSSVLRALELCGAWPGRALLQRTGAPGRQPDDGFAVSLDRAVREASHPIVLVLDDAHEIVEPAAVAALDLLLRHHSSRLRLVLSARFAPPVALPRLRLDGRLRTIDGARLGFTAGEAEELLQAHDIQLSDRDLHLLLTRTEGWAAGLRLAAMSLAGAAEPSRLITEFAGDDRAVADYLVGEVLARLEPHMRAFLLATCVCEEVTPDLARALSGRDDAGALLDQLERTNSFISRLGQDWYRYHPMLRQYLRAELLRQQHDGSRRLHGVAAQWFEARGESLRAIEHAAEAGDRARFATLLGDHGLQHVTSGEGVRVRRAVCRAGPELASHPAVALISAAAALDAHDPASAGRSLARLADGDGDVTRATTEAFSATVALQRARYASDPDTVLALLRGREVDLDEPDLRLLAHLERGIGWFWLGHLEPAETELTRALVLARSERRDWATMQCLAVLGGIALAACDLATAESRAAATLAFAEEHGWSAAPPAAHARLVLGWLAFHAVDDEGAEVHAAASSAAEQREPEDGLAARLLVSFARFGGAIDRHVHVREARETWRARWPGHVQPQFVAVASMIEQRMALDVGSGTWVADVAGRAERLLGATADVAVLRAVAQAQRGRPRAARQLLAPVLDGSLAAVTPMSTIEAWLWEARLAHRANEQQRADAAVSRAVALAGPRGLLRPLVHGGSETAELLSRTVGTHGHHDAFVDRARSLLKTTVGTSDGMLTTRELDLLTELPSLRTVEEIATSMFLSVNTVKTHMRGIYRKLGVNSRRDAVLTARRRGLL